MAECLRKHVEPIVRSGRLLNPLVETPPNLKPALLRCRGWRRRQLRHFVNLTEDF
jgi:hypothetical protein